MQVSSDLEVEREGLCVPAMLWGAPAPACMRLYGNVPRAEGQA